MSNQSRKEAKQLLQKAKEKQDENVVKPRPIIKEKQNSHTEKVWEQVKLQAESRIERKSQQQPTKVVRLGNNNIAGCNNNF